MAEWDQRALALPKEFDDISRNAQNAINSVDTVLSIVKQAGNVAKLFLMLANPAGTIIRLAANEIIQLCEQRQNGNEITYKACLNYVSANK